MADEFISCRGAVYAYSPGGGGGSGGFYALEPGLVGTATSPILIHGCASMDTDVVSPMITLGKKKILYVFGEDFGSIQVAGSVLLGKVGGEGQAMNKVINYFKSHRSTASGKPVSLSLPGSNAYKFYLTGLGISVPDQEFGIQSFAFVGLIAEPA